MEEIMQQTRCWFAGIVFVVFMAAPVAQAQWVMVAHAASGKVQRMSQKKPNGVGYDVATVVLEAKADKVYETAMEALKRHPEITLIKFDTKKRKVEFSNGTQDASLQVTPLGPTVTQLVIASTVSPMQPSATSIVVQGVMRVCKEMNVDCTLQED
jgi:hypothetical protein